MSVGCRDDSQRIDGQADFDAVLRREAITELAVGGAIATPQHFGLTGTHVRQNVRTLHSGSAATSQEEALARMESRGTDQENKNQSTRAARDTFHNGRLALSPRNRSEET